MSIIKSFFVQKAFWNIYKLILALFIASTFIAMIIYGIYEGLSEINIIFQIVDEYLGFMNGVGVIVTSIEEVHILNYLFSHLLIPLFLTIILRVFLILRSR